MRDEKLLYSSISSLLKCHQHIPTNTYTNDISQRLDAASLMQAYRTLYSNTKSYMQKYDVCSALRNSLCALYIFIISPHTCHVKCTLKGLVMLFHRQISVWIYTQITSLTTKLTNNYQVILNDEHLTAILVNRVAQNNACL